MTTARASGNGDFDALPQPSWESLIEEKISREVNQRSDGVRDDMYGWIPEKERVLIVGVGGQRGDERENTYGMEASLAELAELAQSAGLEVVATLTQRMKHPHSGTYVGKGKMRELRRLCGLPDAQASDEDDFIVNEIEDGYPGRRRGLWVERIPD